ncbi:PIN domain-containing protein [Pannonibacter indicus]|uniref:PIN domain-containing protein n=1 Tax=Pannonibacter indicus TaxID=466044 RepID=UPI0035B17DB2
MPELTLEEIKQKIVSGQIQALTVDTNIFDKYGSNLEHPVLLGLSQLKKNNVELLLSEVVVLEINSHLIDKAEESQRNLRKFLKVHLRRWHLTKTPPLDELLSLSVAPADHAKDELAKFLEYVNGTSVDIEDNVGIAPELVKRYFAAMPPFESKESKKFEFPDALALLSLEAHVKGNEGILICVSNDGGWKSFAAQSNHLVIVDDLAVALSLFNQAGEDFVSEIVRLWRDEALANFAAEVTTQIEYWCADLQFEASGDGPASSYVDYQDVQFRTIDEIGDPIIVNFGGRQITFTVRLSVTLDFFADFNFYVTDHVDGDEVIIGSSSTSKESQVQIEATITAEYEDGVDDLENIKVVVGSKRFDVDFGYVDPFTDEDSMFEKY